jgi:hypothetical protein
MPTLWGPLLRQKLSLSLQMDKAEDHINGTPVFGYHMHMIWQYL